MSHDPIPASMNFESIIARTVGRLRRGILIALALLSPTGVPAFPPAPHHVIYGVVRDELGNPLAADTAELFFETGSGAKFSARVHGLGEPGRNYEFRVPMDAGITGDLYMATAMRPTVPFKIRVRIGNVIHLPIEMSGDFAALGEPGKKTRLNLTLGVDSDGDGLPDAWERALIAALAKKQTLAEIQPGDDADGDGLKNVDEYVAGTYAFDKKDGYALKIKGMRGSAAVLEFMSIRGRSYTIHASADLRSWAPVPFRLASEGAAGSERSSLQATDVRLVEVEVEASTSDSPPVFFKLIIQ